MMTEFSENQINKLMSLEGTNYLAARKIGLLWLKEKQAHGLEKQLRLFCETAEVAAILKLRPAALCLNAPR